MVRKRKASLIQGPVGLGLLKLTLPMIVGIFSIVAFNLADTYFVARLGTIELAAMSFTFPVVILINSIALGLGVGTSSVVSRAIGEGDSDKVRRLATHSLILGVLVVAVFVITGIFSIEWVFSLMGATKEVMPLIKRYMTIWYIGMIFVVVPMVGNNAIRATGDTKYPSLIMAISAGINVVLDPILIFGLFGFPRLEIAGAALATVIARSVSMTVSLLILHFRERMLEFSIPHWGQIISSWKKVLYVGLPTALTNILLPLSLGVLTRIAAGFGAKAVAAVGAGMRIEAFAIIVIRALCVSLIPFIGQNWGAKNFKRVHKATLYSQIFSVLWGGVCVLAFFILAPFIAGLFSNDPLVAHYIILYLWIVPFGYGLYGISLVTDSVFNAINKPMVSWFLNIVRMFGLFVPLCLIGAHLYKMKGLLGGVCAANMISGFISFLWIQSFLRRKKS